MPEMTGCPNTFKHLAKIYLIHNTVSYERRICYNSRLISTQFFRALYFAGYRGIKQDSLQIHPLYSVCMLHADHNYRIECYYITRVQIMCVYRYTRQRHGNSFHVPLNCGAKKNVLQQKYYRLYDGFYSFDGAISL